MDVTVPFRINSWSGCRPWSVCVTVDGFTGRIMICELQSSEEQLGVVLGSKK